jgi:hypothetical protein
MIKLMRMRRARHVAHIREKKRVHELLAGRPTLRYEDDIKIHLK